MELTCTPETRLRTLMPDDAPVLLATLNDDRTTFDLWLRNRKARDFTSGCAGMATCWVVFRAGRLMPSTTSPNSATGCARGSGLATRAVQVVMGFLFAEPGGNRVEFQCRVENLRSRGLAERVGGQLEGIRRQSHWVDGAFRDHAVYAVLAGDRRRPQS